jgi:chromate transport protein ChrA
MNLALLVYAVSLLSKFGGVADFLIAASSAMLIILVVITSDILDAEEWWSKFRRFVKPLATIIVVSLIVRVILPSEKTAYMMIGAYTAQKLAADPRTGEVGDKVLTIINQKLDSYITEGASEAVKKINPKP